MYIRRTPEKLALATALCMLLAAASLPAAEPLQRGDVLWANPLDSQADVDVFEQEVKPLAVDGRKGVMKIHKPKAEDASVLRTTALPVDKLQGRWIYLRADVKASNVSRKPQNWNGIKVMLKIDTPGETQWPQIALPVGTFDWQSRSVRILVPADATAITLLLGLEQVSGTVWLDNLSITLAKATVDAEAAPADQPIFKGHSLPRLRGAMVHPEIKRKDLAVLAQQWGGNVIRYQLVRFPTPSEAADLAAYDRWLADRLDHLDKVLAWSRELGVKVVVDLHSPPGPHIGGGGMANAGGAFWTNPQAQAHFVKVWQRITKRYRDNHDTIWAFDLLNEPDDRTVTDGCADWQQLAGRAARAIREIDPQRTLIVEPPSWGGAQGFIGFRPLDLPRVVYSFHMYSPFEYTHQGVDGPAEPVAYPGVINGKEWNKAALAADMAPAVEFARKYRVHMFIGEFSVIRWAPGAAQYLADVTAFFEEHGWDWTYHAFREWQGWNLELGPDRKDEAPTAEPSERLRVILHWMQQNRPAGPRYPEGAAVDITQPPYAATPNDGRDDSDAIQRAITENVGTGRVLYFPAGTYDIRRPLRAKAADGKWQARLTLQGQSRETTTLRLADGCEGFGNAADPQAVIATGSIEEQGDSPDGGGNKAFGNYVLDMTIDTGKDNPGAVGVAWAVSNFGAIKNVRIHSGDDGGAAGIAMTRRIPGPGLIKNVTVEGFDVGIDVADIQYGVTIESVTLRGQNTAGIRNGMNVLHVYQLRSENRCPAVLVTDASGVLTLVDALLEGGDGQRAAVESKGSVLLRDITTQGYGAVVRCRGREAAGPALAQFVEPAAIGAGKMASSALLPIKPTPEINEHDLAQWQAVGPRREGEKDDTAAIQRAIDAGKRVVYFRNDRTYFLGDTVTVRGAVRRIVGMGAEISLGAAKEPFSNIQSPRPLVRIDPTDHDTLILEHMFFNAQYPGEVIFENNSPATLVIRHCAGWVGINGHRRSYRNTDRATGPLFVEDVFLPGWHVRGQRVWARQFNPENLDSDGSEPQVLNEGGRLWILGFKTEGPAPYIATTAGGVTELLGAYNYVSATTAPRVPVRSVPYIITDSRAALTFVTDNFRDNDYDVYIRRASQEQVRDWAGSDLPGRNGHATDRSHAVPLYVSDEGEAK